MTRDERLPEIVHDVDVCVVGGGMAGLCAALAAARRGAHTVLMHDRPVLGGNASSEMRVHICGADRHGSIPHMRETGILEELRLENLARNPNRSFSIWDTILYEAAHFAPYLTLLLNCSCLDAQMDGGHITGITGWQLTTQTRHRVQAKVFADCSGDAILASLTGAEWRMGREARAEYGESIAPEQADARTMGMTCLFHAREYDTPQPFTPPSWAYVFENEDELPYGAGGHRWWEMGYWWVELGGEYDSIHDTEMLRDELLRIVFGLWDHIKNHGDAPASLRSAAQPCQGDASASLRSAAQPCQGDASASLRSAAQVRGAHHGADNWALEWIQFLPAKRESRRYIGDHVLTQGDIESGGRFEDVVAYGGWSMDDHHPAGFWSAKLGHPATIFHPAPSPYGIPYRTLYSRNIDNLMFAGRCASCTHAAMSSTRVMGTACSQGQAVGTAAGMAARLGLLPRDMTRHMTELQQALLRDDCYLPGVIQDMPPLTKTARLVASDGDPEPLRDGISRQVGDDPHAWIARPGQHADYLFDAPVEVGEATLVVDSAMDALIAMSHHQRDNQLRSLPAVMPKAFRIEGLEGGTWRTLAAIEDNHQRLVRLPVGARVEGLRFVLDATWGAEQSRVYAFYVE
jgi:hypothetical protein